jgi:hypothetical protein
LTRIVTIVLEKVEQAPILTGSSIPGRKKKEIMHGFWNCSACMAPMKISCMKLILILELINYHG